MARSKYDKDLAEVFLNEYKYIETLLTVKTKEAKSVPFRFTPIQQRVAREEARRNIQLKPRQVGMSTFHSSFKQFTSFIRTCRRSCGPGPSTLTDRKSISRNSTTATSSLPPVVLTVSAAV
jgi:hypothetical protein